MFEKAIHIIENGLYGVLAKSSKKESKGTGFAVSDRHIVTNAHIVYEDGRGYSKLLTSFQSILDVNIGKKMFYCKFIDDDKVNDIALLEILNSSDYCSSPLSLKKDLELPGNICGAIGYPFDMKNSIGTYLFIKRFKTSFVSFYKNGMMETDQRMYPGFSGSPRFDSDGLVIGIHHSTKEVNKQRVEVSLNASTIAIQNLLNKNNVSFKVI